MRLEIVKGDITKQTTDAIVNAANTSLLGGGGVDGAIHRAAGPGLLEECKSLHGCETGKAKITGGHNLAARYVIHTPGPVWHGGTHSEAAMLSACYRNCLRLAVENGCKSLSFPSISTGVYNYPVSEAAHIAVREICDYLKMHPELERVRIVCFDASTQAAYSRALKQYDVM